MAVEETLRMTEEEANFYQYYDMPYICTITWMQGDYESAKVHLQKRLELMVRKNPWLLGRIESTIKQGSCHLVYSPKPEDSMKMQVEGEETLNVVRPSSSPLSRQMPLSKLNGILRESGLLVSNGPREPVFRILKRGLPSSFNYLMLLEMVRRITNYSTCSVAWKKMKIVLSQ